MRVQGLVRERVQGALQLQQRRAGLANARLPDRELDAAAAADPEARAQIEAMGYAGEE